MWLRLAISDSQKFKALRWHYRLIYSFSIINLAPVNTSCSNLLKIRPGVVYSSSPRRARARARHTQNLGGFRREGRKLQMGRLTSLAPSHK